MRIVLSPARELDGQGPARAGKCVCSSTCVRLCESALLDTPTGRFCALWEAFGLPCGGVFAVLTLTFHTKVRSPRSLRRSQARPWLPGQPLGFVFDALGEPSSCFWVLLGTL